MHLRIPAEHHKRIRHSNFIERTFGETRRRVKAIGRFPSETSCVSPVWGPWTGPHAAGAAPPCPPPPCAPSKASTEPCWSRQHRC
ncbi:transposase [Streptantibioticus ferralitis]|uniref:transposase n=1 Tax=Streptantibioticus ferralitis TaxID=236510 RepID=UPI0035582E19